MHLLYLRCVITLIAQPQLLSHFIWFHLDSVQPGDKISTQKSQFKEEENQMSLLPVAIDSWRKEGGMVCPSLEQSFQPKFTSNVLQNLVDSIWNGSFFSWFHFSKRKFFNNFSSHDLKKKEESKQIVLMND